MGVGRVGGRKGDLRERDLELEGKERLTGLSARAVWGGGGEVWKVKLGPTWKNSFEYSAEGLWVGAVEASAGLR